MTDKLEELSARARRERLHEEDARELAAELAESEEAQLWHRAGLAFDAEDVVLPGDAAATERVLSRVLRNLPVKRPRWRSRSALLFAAAAVLVASVAAAAVLELGAQKHAPAAPSAGTTPPPPVSAAPPAVSVAPPVEAPPDDSAEPPPSASAAPSASTAPTTPPTVTASAAELMSAAGRARRHGDSSQAIEFLNQLQAHYPNSPEARASDVSLGMILLKIGSARSARSHFERYLSRTPQGSLAPDALWGEAQTQFAAGDGSGARRTLHTLLAQFPTSAYSSAARAKLDTP